MASKPTVLLVEDNPMVLALLREALESLAEVEWETSGDAALDLPPDADLVLTDYNMGGINGVELVRRLRGKLPQVPALLMATKAEISNLGPARNEFEEIIEKPFFVRDVMGQVRRVLDKVMLEEMAHQSQRGDELRGTLAQMGVIDLLQSLEMGRKTCALTLITSSERCTMYFADGQITHAECGRLVGDDAVYHAVAWNEGKFRIDFTGRSARQTTKKTTQALLLEGLRLLDEASRDNH